MYVTGSLLCQTPAAACRQSGQVAEITAFYLSSAYQKNLEFFLATFQGVRDV